MALRFHAWLGHKNIRYTVRYTVLSPTGSETSGTDRQSEIVAAINGPIAHLWLPKAKKFNDFSRACVSVYSRIPISRRVVGMVARRHDPKGEIDIVIRKF